MVTSAIANKGVTLTRAGSLVAEVKKIGAPKTTLEAIDVTSHDSANNFREFIGGLLDGGEIGIEGNFIAGDTNGQIGLLTDQLARTVQDFVMTWPTAITATYTFKALVTAFQPGDFDVTGAVKFTATLKISGKPVLAITASANLTDLTGIEENAGAALVFTPAFAAAKKTYNVTINTASTWIKVTPTLAGATIDIYINGVYSQSVASAAQSGTIAVTDAAVTKVELHVKETGKVANVYTLNVYTA